jgi:hypothetical protein
VVIGNAITRGNPEVEEVLNRRLYYLALPVVLKQFFLRGRKNLGVTGTHGKECRRDLAPAGASAAKKRYRGSFQQWGIRLGFTEAARTARSIGVQ